ncbi:aminopeptidase P N-terminal domain-containing protein [bacterium]|nr:aminopeptidase P N-terminal domain-containing protein [bacterium]
MIFDVQADVSLYVSRREKLVSTVKQEHKVQKGAILLFSNFEKDSVDFKQESSFFYLTGLEEPGVAMLCNFDGTSTLYTPKYDMDRSQWMDNTIDVNNPKKLGVTQVGKLGETCSGYSFHPFFTSQQYQNFLQQLKKIVADGGKLFVLAPDNSYEYIEQRFILERIKQFAPEIVSSLVDISGTVATMRRKKDKQEIERMYEAVGITIMAHESAAQAIESEVSEKEVQGALEYIFTASGSQKAFPSVIASGKNGTVLHYTSNNGQLVDGDLVVVDIGAQIGNYCADITRTYPVSGSFTKRQKELYQAVLDTQKFVAEEARPGMWLKNEKEQDKSLYHLAKKFLKARSLDNFFIHGIGHFLGLDVHDVGNIDRPLQEGDVFTIEPGVYIPEENIGIRIEDDFWMVKDGVVCLSEELPKEIDAIEKMMQKEKEDPNGSSFSDSYES